MSTTTIFQKDPDATLDYGFDWGKGYLDSGETITEAVWAIPSGITKVRQEETSTITVVWLSGGTAGTDYPVSCKITTSKGRTDERTLTIMVRQR